MNIKNLKPGDKVKLFKLETLVKKGLIDKYLSREIPDRKIGIAPDMVEMWDYIMTIQEIYKSETTQTLVVATFNSEFAWLPEWIRCRVK